MRYKYILQGTQLPSFLKLAGKQKYEKLSRVYEYQRNLFYKRIFSGENCVKLRAVFTDPGGAGKPEAINLTVNQRLVL